MQHSHKRASSDQDVKSCTSTTKSSIPSVEEQLFQTRNRRSASGPEIQKALETYNSKSNDVSGLGEMVRKASRKSNFMLVGSKDSSDQGDFKSIGFNSDTRPTTNHPTNKLERDQAFYMSMRENKKLDAEKLEKFISSLSEHELTIYQEKQVQERAHEEAKRNMLQNQMAGYSKVNRKKAKCTKVPKRAASDLSKRLSSSTEVLRSAETTSSRAQANDSRRRFVLNKILT